MCSSYYPIFMMFTAVSLMTTTATLHLLFNISTASSAFSLFQFDTLLDTHYRKFAYAQAIALSPYPYFFLPLYLSSPVVSAQGRLLFLQCNIVFFRFSCNCNWVHSRSCCSFFFLHTKNETGKAPKIKDGGFFFSSFLFPFNSRRTRRFKGWKETVREAAGGWGTSTGTGHKLCDSQNDPQSAKNYCMYVQHACARVRQIPIQATARNDLNDIHLLSCTYLFLNDCDYRSHPQFCRNSFSVIDLGT